MNIILTNFAGDNKSPIERSVDKVDKSLSSTDKSFNKMENDRDKEEFRKEKALRKGEVGNYSPPKKNNPPPDPSKNNPSAPSQMNPAINAVPVRKSSQEEEKIVSRTMMAERSKDPTVVSRMDTNSSIGGSDENMFVGELNSTEKKYAELPQTPKYNITSDISSANASSPQQLAALSGVYRR